MALLIEVAGSCPLVPPSPPGAGACSEVALWQLSGMGLAGGEKPKGKEEIKAKKTRMRTSGSNFSPKLLIPSMLEHCLCITCRAIFVCETERERKYLSVEVILAHFFL